MIDEHHNHNPATDRVGEVPTNIPLVLEERLADMKQLLEMNPELSSTEAAQVEVSGVRVSITASEWVSFSF